MGSENGRLRIGFHASRSLRFEHRLVQLLCQRGDTLGCEDQSRALRESLDSHIGFASQRTEVSLPLDSAAGDRSFRSQYGLLRMPGHLQNEQWRAELDCYKS